MITAERLVKTFPAAERGRAPVRALDDVSFTVAEREFYVLLGPSGCGKTTTLRSIAGLEHPDAGRIAINGETVLSPAEGIRVPPEERPIAMVFQSYALWPHMNVTRNISFPLTSGIRRVPKAEMQRRVERVLALLHLTEYAERPTYTLSGGQQQRVALARALALEPAVLLMDEPLSNLDARLRAELRVELKELTRSVGITTIYVTHDQDEAMTMGDRIAVMDQGRLLQEGSPWDLYHKPRHLFVARFLGEMNFIKGEIDGGGDGLVRVAGETGPLLAARAETAPAKGPVWVGFRLEDGSFSGGEGDNVIRGRVAARQYHGDVFLYDVRCGPATVRLRRPKTERLEPDAEVAIHVPPACCIAFGT